MSAVARVKRLVPAGIRHRAVPPLGHLRSQYDPRPLSVPRAYVRPAVPLPAPRISVVVPSLNYGRFLGATLDSLCDQDYPDLELIVCDGGSEDGTGRLLEGKRAHIDRVLHGDGGQSEALNNGFEASTGEIMAWINADDICLPGTLAFVARWFDRHPDVDVIYGNRVLIDEPGNDVGLWVTPRHSPDSIQWFDFLPQETVFWRRSLWERAGGIDPDLHFGLDWDLFLRFHRAGAKFVRIPRFMGAFRQHDEQKTRRCQDEALDELEQIRAEHHGRQVSLEEAQARAEKVLLRAGPHHVFRKLAWRLPRHGIEVAAQPAAHAGVRAPRVDSPVTAVRETG